ncbi:MAG: WYL domain-containing protein [Lachnospiraceae bacterium]|nr:WYL domain-containing protein [Lachnospiraceae bacterium]
MSKNVSNKLRLLYLQKILEQESDDNHRLTRSQIETKLARYGVDAERKTLYNDIEMLRLFGVEVIGEPLGKSYVYYIGGRLFELPELKLLVDAVQASKFITTSKSRKLIKKLTALTSKHEAKQLERQVFVVNRAKVENEKIYYSVDALHNAISSDVRVRFQYTQWTVDKEMKVKKGGEYYEVSPFALLWDHENYYLIAYEGGDDKIKHYRVDKIKDIKLTATARSGYEIFKKHDMPSYTRKTFGMFHGNEENVGICFHESLAGVVIDRFGKDVRLSRAEEGYYTITVPIVVSMQFFAWVIGIGAEMKIVSPPHVVTMMRDALAELTKVYE